jgi:hypothetical protein
VELLTLSDRDFFITPSFATGPATRQRRSTPIFNTIAG